MKSLQESLFDKDLVKKDVDIDFDTLLNMLFEFGRKKKKLFDKVEVIYHEGRQSIFIKKFLGVGNSDDACFELQFGVTNHFPNGVAFNVPTMVLHDRWGGNYVKGWASSRTDVNVTRRKIDKVVELENNNNSIATIEATNDNITKVFDLYDGIIEGFCSTWFEKDLKHYIDQYSEKKAIPGLILDILMKKLIDKA